VGIGGCSSLRFRARTPRPRFDRTFGKRWQPRCNTECREEEVIEHGASPFSVRLRVLIAGLSAVSIAACRPLVMTPAARRVVVASGPADVETCRPRGKVFALAPFAKGQDPMDQLKIRAEVIGADTVLVARKGDESAQTGDWQARAYRCREKVAESGPALELGPSR